MIVFRILHIPTGDFITAFKESSGQASEVSFYDVESAMWFLRELSDSKTYIAGGPITDFKLGNMPINWMSPFPHLSEFELLPFEFSSLSQQDKDRVFRVKFRPFFGSSDFH